MQKNVASQKLLVFAFDSTTNLPKTSDSANITAYVSKDYGSVTVLGDTSATEMDATNAKGYYLFDLTQAETNADTLMFSAKSSTSNIVVIGAPATVFTTAANFNKAVIDSSGLQDANTVKVGPTGSGTPQTAKDLGALNVSGVNTLAGHDPGATLGTGTSTYAGGAVASVTAGVTVSTNNDKIGYALTAPYDASKTAAQAGNQMDLVNAPNATALAAIAAAILDLTDGIETGITLRKAQRAVAAILAGIISGAGTGTEVFKALGAAAGGTTRVTVTVDAAGNRSVETLNL